VMIIIEDTPPDSTGQRRRHMPRVSAEMHTVLGKHGLIHESMGRQQGDRRHHVDQDGGHQSTQSAQVSSWPDYPK
jgi:hypothetical protein